MTKNILLFLGTFLAGALIALAARTARFDPNAGDAHAATPAAHEHASPSDRVAPKAVAAAPAKAPVNTVCAICGMDVDPALPTAQYQGQTIGFGCRMCPPKFKANPEKYGPAYLRNEVIEN